MSLGAVVRRLRETGTAIGLGALVGIACGAASALFLVLLDAATNFRGRNDAIVYALPLAGLVMGRGLEALAPAVRRGTNQIIDAINTDARGPEARVPAVLLPVVLFGTVLTHLFGGSAGREGTAVQMGGAIGEVAARVGKAAPRSGLRRQLLLAGVAGGFGSVFGTPLAGTIFALEFAARGRIPTDALLPALVAALVGDAVTRLLGVVHTAYPAVAPVGFSAALLGKWLLFATIVAAVTAAFLGGLALTKRWMAHHARRLPLAMAVGGLAVVILWRVTGGDAYLGLGVPTIERAFVDPNLPATAFLAKAAFTVLTVGSGFLGGEVTPLFFVGAALGNLLAEVLALPLSLAAGVGLVAVFATAANTPLALCVMAVELMGAPVLGHAALVCVVARGLVGSLGLYAAQRPAEGDDAPSPKAGGDETRGVPAATPPSDHGAG
ncbi:MAG TPA: chloride channel protein [Polyangia bacterium]